MADHFVEILRQAVENRDVKLGDIEISYDLLEVKADMLQEDKGDFNF